MSSEYFKYSATIRAHQSDVRDMCPTMNDYSHFLSASRDMTAKLFAPNDQNEFQEMQCYTGHKKFVACVVFVAPSPNHPDGLVVTGSNDHTILLYNPKSCEIVGSLSGHTNTVCGLSAGNSGTILSSSWDKTARQWKVDPFEVNSIVTYTGHAAAVWSVIELPGENEVVVTASADRSIKVWRQGCCTQTLEGHKDCVRGLSAISSTQFLSCSNDTTVKRWSVEGQCLQTYYGHRSFVYSVFISPHSSEFLTAGEDRTMRVWNISENQPKQTIALPAPTVWKSIFLNNGDVAGGCSDGTIRIFTRLDSRTAISSMKFAFEEELASAQIPEAESGLQNDVDLDQLPGHEALQQPGLRDGQTRMVRAADSTVEVYQWSEANEMWMKIGNMVGSAKSKQKTMYQGKEYDYLFTIDIEEGKPPLNLPYNMTDDPWQAAQNFIDKHNLSQLHLETIANFIIENAHTVGNAQTNSEYVDPFTGGGRYIPESASADSSNQSSDPYTGDGRYVPQNDSRAGPSTGHTNSSDPFTGSGRYVPSNSGLSTATHRSTNDPLLNPSRYVAGSHNKMELSSENEHNMFFPKSTFLLFENAQLSSIMSKLKELIQDDLISDDELKTLEALVEPNHNPQIKEIEVLWAVLGGSKSVCFPAIDLFRLVVVRKPAIGAYICNNWANELLKLLLTQLFPKNEQPTTCRLLAIRALCNLGLSDEGSAFLLAGHDQILAALSSSAFISLTSDINCKTTQTAVATFFINLAVLVMKKNPAAVEEHCQKVRMNSIPALLVCFKAHGPVSSEAAFRYMVALGTLIGVDTVVQTIARSLDASATVQKLSKIHESVEKVKHCAEYLLAVL